MRYNILKYRGDVEMTYNEQNLDISNKILLINVDTGDPYEHI